MSQAISDTYYNEYTRKNLEDSSQFTLIKASSDLNFFKVYARVGIETTQKTKLLFREIYLGTCFIPASAKLDALIVVKEEPTKEVIFPSILLERTALSNSSSSSSSSSSADLPTTSTMQQSEKLLSIHKKHALKKYSQMLS